MEKEDHPPAISDNEITRLIQAAKNKEAAAMLQLLELFQPDIQKLSQYARLPDEEAASEIIVEFLEFVSTHEETTP
ncbi:helix-turn-helix domain-containing protein [Paenibacillus sp. IHB B 3415]|uniref:helix-turn-helix domain-containing protein n=1 Tax=Paenibacillus sp. IHB B 3415 TaxID=867080 RepID=UPI00128BACB9|nr:helix-turn-helix domain-containing protein [Paenibacillus sp. IHB B 3415]